MTLLDNIMKWLRPQKSLMSPMGSGDYNYLPLGLSGVNQDIVFSKMGAAAAYTSVYEVNACIQSITSGIDLIDWNITRYTGGVRRGEKGEIIANRDDLQPRHALSESLWKYQFENKMSFLYTISLDYLLYGEVYVERVENVFGTNKALEWLNPLGMWVDSHSGQIDWFRYGWNMEYLQIPPERIAYLHNRNPNNDFVGLPIALTVLDEINIARNLDRFLRDHFANNARPGMLLTPVDVEHRMSNTDYTNLLNKVREQLKGVGGQYSTMVMQEPLTATAFEQPDIAKNTQLNDQQSIAIYEAFGVPRAMRGNTAVSPYKSGDEVVHRFYMDAVLPLARIVQTYINGQIMPFFDDSGLTIFEFDTSPFDAITESDMLEAQVTDIQVKGTLVDLYTAAATQEIDPDPRLRGLYMVQGVPVPVSELGTYWEKQLLVSPSVYGAEEITGKPLPQPVPPEEIIPTEEGGVPVVEGEARDIAIEAEAEAEQEEQEADEVVEADTGKSHDHDHELLPHFKLYEGDYLFPPEGMIKVRLDRELHAWKRFECDRFGTNPRKKRTREFKTNVIPPWVRFEIIDRLDECKRKSDIIQAFDTVMDAPHIKTITSFQRELRDLSRGLWNDTLSRGQFGNRLDEAIEREYRAAFVEGVHRGGLSVADLSEDETGKLDDLIENEKGFVERLGEFIYNNRKGVGKLNAVRTRVDGWVARYMRVKEVGFIIAKGAEPLLWRYDPRKENCRSCAALNGQIRRASFWFESDITPKSDRLECFGIHCACEFLDAPKGSRISRGRLPKVGWRY